MSDSLFSETTNLDALIVSGLMVHAAIEAWKDGALTNTEDRVRALDAKLAIVREQAAVLRLNAEKILDATNPATLRAVVATAETQAAAQQAAFKDSPLARTMMKRLDAAAADDALKAAEADLAAARGTLGRMARAAQFAATAHERQELNDNVVLAKGAVEAGERRLAEAVAKVAAAGRVG